MTALPLRDFTAAEQAKLAAIEAAPAAAESVRERVARAIWDEAQATVHLVVTFDDDAGTRERQRQERYLRLADAAIAALRGPSSDAEQALEACAQWMESLASPTLSGDPFIRAADWAAKLVREFAGGPTC